MFIFPIEEEFEDTKGLIKICKSKNRQHNDQRGGGQQDKQRLIYKPLHIKLKSNTNRSKIQW